jgi:predicted nucleic acid-binding protein
MVLVDSNIWIRANQPKGDLLAKVALESLLEEDEAAFCGPVKLEVLGAMRPLSRPRFDAYFSLVPYLGMDAATWGQSVAIGRALYDQAKVTLPWNDVLIAAIAQRNNCRVYTMDDHFKTLSRVAGIRLYEPGVGGTFNPDYPTTP